MRALGGIEVERRGAVHGAKSSGELGQNSGERFPQMESLPRTAEVLTGCVRGRGNSRQDGAARGEMERPERQRRRWRVLGHGAEAVRRLCSCGWRAEGGEEE
jgi:hypothetical protein